MPAALAVAADIDDGGSPLAFPSGSPARSPRPPGHPRPDRGPADRTVAYLVMSDDVGDGTLAFSDDTVRVDWPAVGDLIFDHNADTLDALSRAMPAEYVANPVWSPMLREGLVTVHRSAGAPWATTGPPASSTTAAGCSPGKAKCTTGCSSPTVPSCGRWR